MSSALGVVSVTIGCLWLVACAAAIVGVGTRPSAPAAADVPASSPVKMRDTPKPPVDSGWNPVPASGAFAIGSYKGEVAAIQGQPRSIIGETWSYGYSSVYFGADKRVDGYAIVDIPLRVSFLPKGKDSGSFQVGSTKDEVLATQGAPSTMIGNTWSYGYSSVYFNEKNRVTGYSVIDVLLKITR